MVLSVFVVTWLTLEPRTQPSLQDPFRAIGTEAVRLYEQQDKDALQAYQAILDKNLKRPVFILDEDGQEIFGRAVNDRMKRAALGIPRNAGPREPPPPFMTNRVQGVSGHTYYFISEMPPPPSQIAASYPRLALQILAVLSSVGFVCYVLAHYLTAPIVKLREATRKLASGDLSARVGNSIGKRKDEVADLGRDFDQMAERIEALMNGQRRLLGDISHELRSPLTRLNLALGVARRQAGELAVKSHDRIELEAERLNELIGQLLRLTEMESGEHLIKREPVNLAELIKEITTDADFEARNRNRAVRVVTAENCEIIGDESLLRSAIENVVRNAIRYTAEGTEVEISVFRRPAKEQLPIEITVRDHGSGVPEASLDKLFRPFYRVADARDRQSGGAGLGLSITERAINLHNGTVSATNAPNQGLIVILRLPDPL